MLLNASQPFLPGRGVESCRRTAAVRCWVGMGGAADLKTWWKRAAGTDGGVGGVIGHAREVCCARPSNALVLFAVSFPLWCVCVYLNLQHTENQTTLLAK